MGIDFFNELDDVTKVAFIINQGTLLKTVDIGAYSYSLYYTSEFYVKFGYRKEEYKIIEVTAFESPQSPERLLAEIDLIKLFEEGFPR